MADFNKTKTVADRIGNVAVISINSELESNRYEYESMMFGNRFLNTSAMLPKGEFLGLQISKQDGGDIQTVAFASAETLVTREDFNWMFDHCGKADSNTQCKLSEISGEGRKVYMLASAEGSSLDVSNVPMKGDIKTVSYNNDYYDDEYENVSVNLIPDRNEYLKDWSDELFGMLMEAGAIIRITAGHSEIKESGHGSVMISFPGAMPLRIRSMISMAYPHMVAKDLEEEKILSNKAGNLSDTCFVGSLIRFLGALLANASKLKQETERDAQYENDGIEDTFDKDSYYDSEDEERFASAPGQADGEGNTNDPEGFRDMKIVDMELSVRTTNCLRRAGIETLRDLLDTTEDELNKVRNFGRKCNEEVKYVLERLGLKLKTDHRKKICYNLDSLNEMIGLENVKAQIRKMTAFAKLKKGMADQGKDMKDITFSMAFLGNPGTAKTTVARIVAGIFNEIGLLEKATVCEAGRSDLVGKYVGHTAAQTKRMFEEARGGILFIDEAYSLVDDSENSYGDEAINTIVQEMENHRDDTIVIFAGYPDKMEAFFARNPGLKSRIPFKIHFNDYSAEEMCQIAELEAKKRSFTIAPSAYGRLKEVCETAVGNTEAGNGRFCRNLIENSIMEYALRNFGNSDSSNSNAEDNGMAAVTDSNGVAPDGNGTTVPTGSDVAVTEGSGAEVATGSIIGNLELQASDFVITELIPKTKEKNVIGF